MEIYRIFKSLKRGLTEVFGEIAVSKCTKKPRKLRQDLAAVVGIIYIYPHGFGIKSEVKTVKIELCTELSTLSTFI